jgi:hypothetical protein
VEVNRRMAKSENKGTINQGLLNHASSETGRPLSVTATGGPKMR